MGECNCSMCGKSIEDFLIEIDLKIQKLKWIVLFIKGECPFAYTIGLFQNFKHPELIIANKTYQESMQILNQIGEKIKNGLSFKKDTELELTNKLRIKFSDSALSKEAHILAKYYGFHVDILEILEGD